MKNHILVDLEIYKHEAIDAGSKLFSVAGNFISASCCMYGQCSNAEYERNIEMNIIDENEKFLDIMSYIYYLA